ncbi:transcriptional regulator [Streptomyces sp. KS 21]|uniref:transcriptional regulator n=1 Tax=Streptomyces sp. KS 21 TaxID=2485150 RepID=UPI001414DDF6|nr:transcriptional regulator [Streptomyces sp. KS 21]
MALHRSWVLADTNRSRKGAGGGAKAQPAAATVTAGPRASEREPGPAAQAPAGNGILPAGAAVPSDPPAPKARRRLRRAVLAGIAVTAVTGAVAFTASLAGRDAGVRDSPVGAATAAHGEGGRTQGSTASAAASAASPSDSASPADGAGAGPETAGADAASTPSPPGRGEDPAPGTPVKVTTQPYTWEAPCGQHYLIDKPPAQVGPPPVERDAPAWVAASGAVSAGEQYVTLTLQGAGKDTVVLDSLTVRTAGKPTPLAWNDYAMGYPGVGCGAGVPTRSFTVALDAARPAVVPEEGQPDFPFKVSESEPEVFHIKAGASAYDVNWYLELSWSSGSRHGTLTIDHNGKPFRTSGRGGRPGYEFPLGGDGWVKAGTTIR